jgi:hypothetical protein
MTVGMPSALSRAASTSRRPPAANGVGPHRGGPRVRPSSHDLSLSLSLYRPQPCSSIISGRASSHQYCRLDGIEARAKNRCDIVIFITAVPCTRKLLSVSAIASSSVMAPRRRHSRAAHGGKETDRRHWPKVPSRRWLKRRACAAYQNQQALGFAATAIARCRPANRTDQPG